MSNGTENLIRTIQQKDPSFYKGQDPAQLAESLKDPYAAASFYDVLQKRYPSSINLERDAFVQKVAGKPLPKVKMNRETVQSMAQWIKKNKPDFKGDVSSSDLATAWLEADDPMRIYKDLEEGGLSDISYGTFQQLIQEKPKLPPLVEKPKPPKKDDASIFEKAIGWLTNEEAQEEQELKPVPMSGGEDPLAYGITKQGNYKERMKLYDDTPNLQQKGRVILGTEAISIFEKDAKNNASYYTREYDRKNGKGAFDAAMTEYMGIMAAANMNPDQEQAQRDIEVWKSRNKALIEDPNFKGAFNAIRGLNSAAQKRAQLFKENPKMIEREIALKAAQANLWSEEGGWSFDKMIAQGGGGMVARSFGRMVKSLGEGFGSDTLANWGDQFTTVFTNPEREGETTFQYYTVDENQNKVFVDPDTRQIIFAESSDGKKLKDYTPTQEFENQLQYEALEKKFNPGNLLYSTGEVVADLALDAALTYGTFGVGKALSMSAKTARLVGIALPQAMRMQGDIVQEALAAGRTREGAIMDQIVKGTLIGMTSLINPLEGAFLSKALPGVGGKALNDTLRRYSLGQITYGDMLREFGKTTLRSAGGEMAEETIQDFVINKGINGINNILMDTRYDASWNPDELVETLMISGLVGVLGGGVEGVRDFDRSNLMSDAIRSVLDNPDKVNNLLEGLKISDPELAREKAERIQAITSSIKALDLKDDVKIPVARLLVQRDAIKNQLNKVGRDGPAGVVEGLEKELVAVDAAIDAVIAGKKPAPEAAAAGEGAEPVPAAEGAIPEADMEAIALERDEKRPRRSLEEQVKATPPDMPDEAWTLGTSTNQKDVAGFEVWRLQALDKKGSELSKEEREVFGPNLDLDKTVREQLGDAAGIPQPAPQETPEAIDAFDSMLMRAGFLAFTDPETNRKGVRLVKKRKEGTGREKEVFYYGAERDQKLKDIIDAIETVRSSGGDMRDLNNALDRLNVQFDFGDDMLWNQTYGGFASKLYQDTFLESLIRYKAPSAPAMTKVRVGKKGAEVEFTFNAVSNRWEDGEGKPASATRMKQIQNFIDKARVTAAPPPPTGAGAAATTAAKMAPPSYGPPTKAVRPIIIKDKAGNPIKYSYDKNKRHWVDKDGKRATGYRESMLNKMAADREIADQQRKEEKAIKAIETKYDVKVTRMPDGSVTVAVENPTKNKKADNARRDDAKKELEALGIKIQAAAKAAAPQPAPQPAAPTVDVNAELPVDLAGGSPSFAYGKKQFKLDFASDIDKALYTVSGKGKSRRHDDYIKWLLAQGLTEAEIKEQGAAIRETIKEMARTKNPGTLKIPVQYSPAAPTPTPTPAPAPAPTPAPTPAPKATEELPPSKLQPLLDKRAEVEFSLNQMEADLQKKVDALVKNGAPRAEAEKLAYDELDKKDKKAIDKLRADLAKLDAELTATLESLTPEESALEVTRTIKSDADIETLAKQAEADTSPKGITALVKVLKSIKTKHATAYPKFAENVDKLIKRLEVTKQKAPKAPSAEMVEAQQQAMEAAAARADELNAMAEDARNKAKGKNAAEQEVLNEFANKVEDLATRTKAGEFIDAQQLKKAAARIRKLKIQGKTFDATLGIPVGIWNSALELAAITLEAGASIVEAIQKAVDFINTTHKEDWDATRGEGVIKQAITGIRNGVDPLFAERPELAKDILGALGYNADVEGGAAAFTPQQIYRAKYLYSRFLEKNYPDADVAQIATQLDSKKVTQEFADFVANMPEPKILSRPTVKGKTVGTRNPTAKKAQEVGSDPTALSRLEVMERNPVLYKKNALLLAFYDILAPIVPKKTRAALDKAAVPLNKIDEDIAAAELAIEMALEDLAKAVQAKQPSGKEVKGMSLANARKLAKAINEGKEVVPGTAGLVKKLQTLRTKLETLKDKRKNEVLPAYTKSIANLANTMSMADAKAIYTELIRVTEDNLRELVELFPRSLRNFAKLWYDGANIIAQEFGEIYGYSLEQVSAVMAVFSPQKDWFMNISLAERAIRIWKTQQESTFDEAMEQRYMFRAGMPAVIDFDEAGVPIFAGKVKALLDEDKKPVLDEDGNYVVIGWDEAGTKEARDSAKAFLNSVKGVKLKDMPLAAQARFIRMYSEVYDSPNFNVYTPNGRVGDIAVSEKGTPITIAWGGYNTIEKAISIMTADPQNVMTVISDNLGSYHKVRNFYNNIADPASTDNHVTMDTHAIAALLWKGLSGASREVIQNFGGAGTVNDSNLGINGLYPVFAEAYISAANKLGYLPREIQSITWEAVRMLFPAKWKANKANTKAVDEIWKQFANGQLTIEEVRSQIFELARKVSITQAKNDGTGVGSPNWSNAFDGEAYTGGIEAATYSEPVYEGGRILRYDLGRAIRESRIASGTAGVVSGPAEGGQPADLGVTGKVEPIATRPLTKPQMRKDLRPKNVLQAPVESSAGLQKEIVEKIDAYVKDAAANNTPILLEELFPEGLPPGVTEATVQARYIIALRSNPSTLMQQMRSAVARIFPATQSTAEDQLNLEKVRNRKVGYVKPQSLFELRKAAKNAKGEAKRAYELAEKLSNTLRASGVTITLHETIESYANGVGMIVADNIEARAISTSGMYGNKQIHLFVGKPGFNADTAMHEAVHPMLIEAMATHPELYRSLVQEMVSDPDLFNRYWMDFAWDRYATEPPKTAEEAAALLDELDNEALTEMLASKTMEKLMQNLPKQKLSIREKLRRFLADLMDKLGFTTLGDAVYRRMASNAVFNNFFDDIKTVDDFATQLADAIASSKGIPLTKLYSSDNKIYAAKSRMEALDTKEQIIRAIEGFEQINGEFPSYRDAHSLFYDQILDKSSPVTEDLFREAFEEARTGIVGNKSNFASWYGKEAPIHRIYGDKHSLYYTKDFLNKIREDLPMAPYVPGHKSATEVDAEALNDPNFKNPAFAYQTAEAVINGQVYALTPAQERAIAYTIYVLEERARQLETDIASLQEKEADEARYDLLYGELMALHDGIDVMTRAVQMSGTAHARALSFRQRDLAAYTDKYAQSAKVYLRAKGAPKSVQEAVDVAGRYLVRLNKKLKPYLNDSNQKRAVAFRAMWAKTLDELVSAGVADAVTIQAILDKYSKKHKPSAHADKPLFLTSGDTTDMKQFMYDLKQVTLIYRKNNKGIDLDTLVGEVIRMYEGVGIEINEMDVYVAMVYDSPVRVQESIDEYEAARRDVDRMARKARQLGSYISDFSVMIEERLRAYKKDIEEARNARVSDLFSTVPERNAQYELVTSVITELKAQAAAFEIDPIAFQHLQENMNGLETTFNNMFRMDYPITERQLAKIIGNIRNIQQFFSEKRLLEAHQKIDEKVAALRGAATPEQKYLAIAALSPFVSKKYESPEVAKLRKQLEDKRKEIKRVVEDYKRTQTSGWRKFVSKTLNTLRVSLTVLDLSAVLNQGAMALRLYLGNTLNKDPRFGDAKSAMKMYWRGNLAAKAELMNRDSTLTDNAYDEILDDPVFTVAKMAGLAISPPREGLELSEEFFMESWWDDLGNWSTEKFKGKGKAGELVAAVGDLPKRVKDASEAAYVTYLNALRFDMFKKYYAAAVESGRVVSPDELKVIAESINVWTGRADSLFGMKISPIVSSILWAPRYYAAQIKGMMYLATSPYRLAMALEKSKGKRLSGRDQLEIAALGNGNFEAGLKVFQNKQRAVYQAYTYRMRGTAIQLVMFGAQQVAMYGMMKAMCGEDGGMGLDYTKSTFLKFQCGREVYDLSGGYAYWGRFATQIGGAFAGSYNMMDKPEGLFGRMNAEDLTKEMVSSKYNPTVQFMFAVLTNEDFRGQPFGDNIGEALANIVGASIVPISIKSGYDLYQETKEDPAGIIPDIAKLTLILHGMNYYTSDNDLNNLTVAQAISDINAIQEEKGGSIYQVQPRPEDPFKQKNNPFLYAEYKKEFYEAVGVYMKEKIDAGDPPTYEEMKSASKRINTELNAKYMQRLEEGDSQE